MVQNQSKVASQLRLPPVSFVSNSFSSPGRWGQTIFFYHRILAVLNGPTRKTVSCTLKQRNVVGIFGGFCESTGLGRWTYGDGCVSQFLLERFPQRAVRNMRKNTCNHQERRILSDLLVDSEYICWTSRCEQWTFALFFAKCLFSNNNFWKVSPQKSAIFRSQPELNPDGPVERFKSSSIEISPHGSWMVTEKSLGSKPSVFWGFRVGCVPLVWSNWTTYHVMNLKDFVSQQLTLFFWSASLFYRGFSPFFLG